MRWVVATLAVLFFALTPRGIYSQTQTNARASCKIAEHSILSWNASGETQVTNLDGVEVTCNVTPARPFYPNIKLKPGETRDPLHVTVVSYQLDDDGTRHEFPTEVKESGGGSDGAANLEFVQFMFLIKLPPDELEAESRRCIDKLKAAEQAMHWETAPFDDEKAMANLRELIAQQRVGHYRVEFRLTVGGEVRATDSAEIEVVYKGHYADVFLPADPTTK
jgi:hypothetical protein